MKSLLLIIFFIYKTRAQYHSINLTLVVAFLWWGSAMARMVANCCLVKKQKTEVKKGKFLCENWEAIFIILGEKRGRWVRECAVRIGGGGGLSGDFGGERGKWWCCVEKDQCMCGKVRVTAFVVMLPVKCGVECGRVLRFDAPSKHYCWFSLITVH